MASFYHFKKHEYMTFSKLIGSNTDLENKTKKHIDDFEYKKRKLFNNRDIKKWKLSPQVLQQVDIQKVFDDYEKIKPYMLP